MAHTPDPSNGVLRIGCGAGFSGDRWDAAVAVVGNDAAGVRHFNEGSQ